MTERPCRPWPAACTGLRAAARRRWRHAWPACSPRPWTANTAARTAATSPRPSSPGTWRTSCPVSPAGRAHSTAGPSSSPVPARRARSQEPIRERRAPLPVPIAGALTRAQLEALEATPSPPLLEARVRSALETSPAPVDAEDCRRLLERIPVLDARLERMTTRRELSQPLQDALLRLHPVLVHAHLTSGNRDPDDATDLVTGLVRGCLDLEPGLGDPRETLVEELVGDLLACYVGRPADLGPVVEEALARLQHLQSRQQQIRRRGRERASADRRRDRAREAAAAASDRLAQRRDLAGFIRGPWHRALMQAHLRFGPESALWTRMLELGQELLVADAAALERLRPALVDALGLTEPDPTRVEQTLDDLARSLEQPAEPTVLPSGAPAPASSRDLSPLPDADPLLLADGRRRWLLVQPEEGAGQVLLMDALALLPEWVRADDLRAGIDSGQVSVLDPDEVLADWALPAGDRVGIRGPSLFRPRRSPPRSAPAIRGRPEHAPPSPRRPGSRRPPRR
ncbi:MAG: hypothetical protein U5R48_12020 [Gammaproteobacteria bacterium]|nr:hypothetical protein [Gammaproteobacteria bacterium]